MFFIILHLRSQSIFRYDAKKNRSLLKLNLPQITPYFERKRRRESCYPLGINFCDCVCDLGAFCFYRNFVRHKVSAFKALCEYPMQFKVFFLRTSYSERPPPIPSKYREQIPKIYMVGVIVFSAQTNPIKCNSSARQKQAFVNFAFKGNLFKVIVQRIVYIPWIYVLPKTSLSHVSCPTFRFPLRLASSPSALREFANISPIYRRRALWCVCGG